MKEMLAYFLIKLWCKDVTLMLYWVKHFSLKLFFDWIFFWKYFVINVRQNTWKISRNFKEYFQDNNFKKIKNNLIKGLDEKSVDTIEKIEKVLNIILNLESNACLKKSYFWIDYKEDLCLDKYIKEYTKDIYLPINRKEQTVFYYKHWIEEVENLEKVNWKDILDCWAFIWDSAMMFEKELHISDKWWHIYCIEPAEKNRKLLEKTILRNNKKWKIIPIPLWVWAKKENSYINFDWSASHILKQGSTDNEVIVDTIDNIVKENNINPWIIKRDIEWLEYDSIIWAEKTIRKYRPILLISIYHTWKDFYEIKPLLESWDLWYHFKIRHLSNHPYFETMLICY